ncbi:MAG: tetratricopeptide repeat protein [Bradymonadaceae bacterium]
MSEQRDRRPVRALGLASLLAVLAWNCGGAADDSRTTAYVHPLAGPDEFDSTVSSPAPPVSMDEKPGYRSIVEAFKKNASALFKRSDIDKRIEQIERVFVATGHYLDLVAIYQRVVDEQGLASPAAPRLAWAYIRLGQRRLARKLIDRLERARPESARVAYLEGAFWFDRASQSKKAAARTVRAWRRALERNPDLQGFGGVGASQLKRQLARLEKRLGSSPEAILGSDERPSSTDTSPPRSDGSGESSIGGETEPSSSADPPDERGGEDDSDAGEDSSAAEPTDEPTADSSAGAAPSRTNTDRSDGSTEDTGQVADRAVIEGQLALESGAPRKAQSRFERALEHAPGRVDARLGLLRAKLRAGGDPDALADDLRKLVERQDLSARQAYDAALFARVKLEDDGLAVRLLERVRRLDPAFAKRIGVSELIDQSQR